ncbi:glutaredoxin family protein [Streptomyces sp. B93]|uniref:glutaredoxin family protein n=1 Tax=Streptomyces sp. B93 TaxID=2824875 RepID=UPI001B398DB4|nr:glutaredoxin family protein [Streptomyces sp. B93]MBQ1092309.1 glutaredoxin family protein [Streptomyces sp. B93]
MSPLFRRKTADVAAAAADPRAPHERLVTLIRKPGCHLCDDAQAVIEKVCGDLSVPWEEKDITQDPRLHDAYWEQIPVVLVDGEQHTFWRVNEERLRKALTE